MKSKVICLWSRHVVTDGGFVDFEFNRFSPRSFERFAQSLAVRYLGAGVKVYGDGADAAREASFHGPLNFPTEKNAWNGFTVIQAKFRQRSLDAAKDAEWLVQELRTELDKFLDKTRELNKLEFYLLITNARLSPGPKQSAVVEV